MATESYVLSTLPVSAHPDDAVHVSLFVTHRLTPDGTSGRLDDFPTVARWANALRGATVTLIGVVADGTERSVPCTPDLRALESRLWERVFPADLTVRPWSTPELSDAEWRTFPAARMEAHALLAHLVSATASPVQPPRPRGQPLLPLALGLNPVRFAEDGTSAPRFPLLDNESVRIAARPFSGGSTHSREAILTQDLAAVTRFYRRSRAVYRERPDRRLAPPPVEPPTPDFHERASMLDDLSPLLRRLGLVVDVRVDDVAALTGLTRIRAHLQVTDMDVPDRQPATLCSTRGTTFTPVTRSGPDEFAGHALRLGDEELFDVLSLDPDASGLKLDQFLGTLTDALLAELNGDPVHAAPPALRATGFAIARIGRADRLREQAADALRHQDAWEGGERPVLGREDLLRGLRIEVWDDVDARWRSLHRRRLTVEVENGGPDGDTVLADVPDVGFLQASNVTRDADPEPGEQPDVYAHEVLAGWDGWSLSAPRPGRTSVHVPAAGDEPGHDELRDAPDEPPTLANPVRVRTRVEPGTLPWLRFGRSYCFRAWAVDLAGNDGAPAPRRPQDPARPSMDDTTKLAQTGVRARRERATRRAPAAGLLTPEVLEALRESATTTSRTSRDERPDGLARRSRVPSPTAVLRRQVEAHAVDLSLAVAARAGTAAEPTAAAAATLRRAFTVHLDEHLRGGLSLADLAEQLQLLADTVTDPVPFLRWDPVLEPAVVPRHAWSEGESLLTLVVRSGVDVAVAEDGTVGVRLVGPAEYAERAEREHTSLGLRRRATSERHLAPPKVAQLTAEQHGAFDAAFGGGPDDVRRALALALREAGTFMDTDVADLDMPGRRVLLDGVRVETGPTADPPPGRVPDSAPPPGTRGTVLPAGSYVVHDVDTAEVPYLPDPLAAGVALHFPDAEPAADTSDGGEVTRLEYAGTWPRPVPWRLVLQSGPELAARADGTALLLALPPGEQLTVDLSTALRGGELPMLGLWRAFTTAWQLPQALVELFAEAAAAGLFWWLTPSVRLKLVHATPRPVRAPHIASLQVQRTPGLTDARLVGAVGVHGASTDSLDLEATWTETVDDPAADGPTSTPAWAAVAHVPVSPGDELVVTTPDEPGPEDGLARHALTHTVGDTRHRVVTYRARATTRYREYFNPRTYAAPEDATLVSGPRTVSVPSCARPPRPAVRDVLPLFLWEQETQPGHPFALRRTRRGGLRLYLERPWYATGEGEQLAVVLGPQHLPSDHLRTASTTEAEARETSMQVLTVGLEQYSRWAADPAVPQSAPANSLLPPHALVTTADLLGDPEQPTPGRPVPGSAVTLPDLAPGLHDMLAHQRGLAAGGPGGPVRRGESMLTLIGYAPQYSPERRLWYVDVPLDTGTASWPFVSLVVARYQPESLAGLHLSPLVRCPLTQVPPWRTATVSRPDDRTALVELVGPAPLGVEDGVRHNVRAHLQRRTDPSTDLGWETVTIQSLDWVPRDVTRWFGRLDLTEAMGPARPGDPDGDWRVAIEERQSLPADAPEREQARAERIVYIDHLPL